MPSSQPLSPRRLPFFVALALFSIALPPFVSAQPLRLTMADTVARALQSSYQVVTVDKQISSAETYLERSQAWLASNPTITGGGSTSDSKFESTLPNNQAGPSQRFGPAYTFTAEQSFEVAGQRGLRIDAATHGLESTRHDRRNTEAVVRAEAKKAFTAALESAQKADLAARSADLIQQVNAAFHPSAKDSDKERIAYNSSTMQLHRQRRRVVSTGRDRDEAYRQVKRLAGIPPEMEIEIVGELESRPRTLPSLEELRIGLADRRPDVAAYRSLVARTETEVTLAKRSAIPDVSVFGFITRFDGGNDTETSGGGSLGVTLPIFQSEGPSVPDAVSERQRAAAELDDLVRTVEVNLATAYTNAQEAAEDLDLVINEILPRARENVELQQHRARRHEIASYDVVDYDIELVNAEEEFLSARRAYTDALIELEKAASVTLVGGPEVSAAPAAQTEENGEAGD